MCLYVRVCACARERERDREEENEGELLVENETEGRERERRGEGRENKRTKGIKDRRLNTHASRSRRKIDIQYFPMNYGRFCQIVPFGETDEK